MGLFFRLGGLVLFSDPLISSVWISLLLIQDPHFLPMFPFQVWDLFLVPQDFGIVSSRAVFEILLLIVEFIYTSLVSVYSIFDIIYLVFHFIIFRLHFVNILLRKRETLLELFYGTLQSTDFIFVVFLQDIH